MLFCLSEVVSGLDCSGREVLYDVTRCVKEVDVVSCGVAGLVVRQETGSFHRGR